MGLVSFQEISEGLPCPFHVKTQGEDCHQWTREVDLPDVEPVGALIWDFPAFRNAFLLFDKHPVYGILL